MREIHIVTKNTSKHFEDTLFRHFELGEAMREIHKKSIKIFQTMDPYGLRPQDDGLAGTVGQALPDKNLVHIIK